MSIETRIVCPSPPPAPQQVLAGLDVDVTPADAQSWDGIVIDRFLHARTEQEHGRTVVTLSSRATPAKASLILDIASALASSSGGYVEDEEGAQLFRALPPDEVRQRVQEALATGTLPAVVRWIEGSDSLDAGRVAAPLLVRALIAHPERHDLTAVLDRWHIRDPWLDQTLRQDDLDLPGVLRAANARHAAAEARAREEELLARGAREAARTAALEERAAQVRLDDESRGTWVSRWSGGEPEALDVLEVWSRRCTGPERARLGEAVVDSIQDARGPALGKLLETLGRLGYVEALDRLDRASLSARTEPELVDYVLRALARAQA